MLHKCGKKIETISQKIPTFVEVTGDKLVGGLFSGGGQGGGLGLGGGGGGGGGGGLGENLFRTLIKVR